MKFRIPALPTSADLLARLGGGSAPAQRSGSSDTQAWPDLANSFGGGGGFFPYAGSAGGYKNSRTGAGTSSDISTRGYFQPTYWWERSLGETVYAESWAAHKMIDTPVDDMKWRVYPRADDDYVGAMEEAEEDLMVEERLRMAAKAARLHGSAMVIPISVENTMDQPFSPELIREGDLRNILVVDRYYCTPLEYEANPANPGFALPSKYRLNFASLAASVETSDDASAVEMLRDLTPGMEIHASRVLRFEGIQALTLPGWQVYERDWSRSELIPAFTAILQQSSVTQSMANLSEQASVRVMKLARYRSMIQANAPRDMDRADPYQTITSSLSAISNYGTLLMDKDDDFERVQVQFGGVAEMMDRFAMIVAAAADIPETRFWGKSPSGMNATGESDLSMYRARVNSLQGRLWTRPMRALDQWLLPSVGLREAEKFRWRSQDEMTETEKVDLALKKAQIAQILAGANVMAEPELRAMLSGDDVIGELAEEYPLEDMHPLQQQEREQAEQDEAEQRSQELAMAKLMAASSGNGNGAAPRAPAR